MAQAPALEVLTVHARQLGNTLSEFVWCQHIGRGQVLSHAIKDGLLASRGVQEGQAVGHHLVVIVVSGHDQAPRKRLTHSPVNQ